MVCHSCRSTLGYTFILISKNSSSSRWESLDAGWEWRFQWRRSLFDVEIDMTAKFLEDIEGITIHPDRQDKWVWKGDSSGECVHVAYERFHR